LAILTRFKTAWNAFRSNAEQVPDYSNIGPSSYGPSASKPRFRFYNERTIISSIYARISIDVAGILIRHIKVDEEDRYAEDISSSLNQCLNFEPNIDQGPRAFRQDIVMTLFDQGVAVIVPVDIQTDDVNPEEIQIVTVRVGSVVAFYPKHVRVSLYNEATGLREEIVLEKRFVAIVENPLYAVMNEPNSTLQRLIRKLGLLDAVDEQSSSGKLDIIIQLPYVIKSEARRQQAEKRREDIEFQLKGSQYGIAYTDGTEKITQLNRPAENNLLNQVEYLTKMLYGQLGITEDVMNGTADEKVMLNYYNRTVEPILDAMVEAMQRSFLRISGMNNLERIVYFRNPFKLVPITQLAEIADKFSRNEILSPNEFRGFMGIRPSKDPKADKLQNSNMPQPQLESQQQLQLGPGS
jgi:Phage portal protein